MKITLIQIDQIQFIKKIVYLEIIKENIVKLIQ